MRFYTPASTNFRFYTSTTNTCTISSAGVLNVSGNLQEAGTSLTSKYLQLSGGTLTNSLTISTGSLNITNATGILSMGSKFLTNIINLYSTTYGIGVPSATEMRFYTPASTNFRFYTSTTNTATISSAGNITATSFTGSGASLTNIPYSSLTGAPTVYTQSQIDTFLSAKQATLTAATNLLGIGSAITALDYDKITINKPSVFPADLSTVYTKTAADTRYLQLIGGTLTGDLQISKTNPFLTINSALEDQAATIYLCTPFTPSHAFKTAIISQGINSWGRSKLHFCLNNVENNSENATISHSRMVIYPSGNIGIGTTDPLTNKLYVNGTSYINGDLTLNSTNLNFQLGGTTGNNIAIPSSAGFFSTSAAANDMVIRSTNNLHLLSGIGNSAITIKATTNNIGIGTNNPINILQVGAGGRLRIANTNSDYTLIGCQDADTDTNTRIVLSGNTRTGALGFIDYNATSTGHHIFNTTNARTERLRITSGGGIAIGTTDPLTYKLNVNGTSYFNDALTIASAANPKYLYASGLRIAGTDGNTLYNDVYPIGISALNTISLITGTSLANYATRLKIATNGNIGIATEPSAYNLHINGTTKIDSSLNVGALTTAGNVNLTGTWAFNCYGPAMFDYDLSCRLLTTSQQNPHDYVGITSETSAGSTGVYTLRTILNSFTGFHRSFTNDELFDENDPQLFKDTYEGRIVISTGRIATQSGNQKDGYEIKYDKDGIYTEDAHPLIELSRTKKDKRVFGVLGRSNRNNSNEKRMIINGLGEGALWVCNSNGNIENGDYITSSDHLGFGEKQDDDILHNYSVAKALMNCDFQLDSPLYQSIELSNGFRVAFIACSYHCS
jgi:hypothetical protein